MSHSTKTTLWKKLQQHYRDIGQKPLSAWFSGDKQRFQRFSLEAEGLLLDYSKNHIGPETMDLLFQLAEVCELKQKIEDLMSGAVVNRSENRPALHTALRCLDDGSGPIKVEGKDILPAIRTALSQMNEIASAIRERRYLGFSGQPVTAILHFGIGGSDLGQRMLFAALEKWVDPALRYEFFSYPDSAHVQQTLKRYDPATTLVIIASKSFTTIETLANAEIAKNWLLQAAPSAAAAAAQIIAVTAKPERAAAFGVSAKQVLPVWEWVGGRFSVWSAMSLIIAAAVGTDRFREFLAGAQAMDNHFRSQAFSQNMPVILGLLDVWYNNFFGKSSRAVIPYGRILRHFPDYLQQVFMESLGKRVNQSGEPVDEAAGGVIWGGTGTNSQHSFHQLLLQGNQWAPVDFILPLTDLSLAANALAQSEILMTGYGEKENLAAYQVLPGNRPSNLLLFPEVTPAVLGALFALYEHRVYVNSVIWDINAFDQWGVERGKVMAKQMWTELTSGANTQNELIHWIKKNRGTPS